MTVREAAHLLQLSECSVYQLAGLGQLPSVKIGKARRFLLEDVQAFITSNRQQAVLARKDTGVHPIFDAICDDIGTGHAILEKEVPK